METYLCWRNIPLMLNNKNKLLGSFKENTYENIFCKIFLYYDKKED